MITLVRAYLADTLCKRKNERKKKHREQSHRMTSGHKSLVDLKMTSREALYGLQKHSGSCYQERLRGPRELDALLTRDTITLSGPEPLSVEPALGGSPNHLPNLFPSTASINIPAQPGRRVDEG